MQPAHHNSLAHSRIILLLLLLVLLSACQVRGPFQSRATPGPCGIGGGSYVALGSSSTEGAGASEPQRTGYVALLHSRLQEVCPGAHLANLGRGGARVDLYIDQLGEIERAQPDLITILPFADFQNTPPDAFRAGYTRLLDGLAPLKATLFFGDQRIDPRYVCGRAPADRQCYGEDEARKIAAKNAIVAELARERPWVVIVPIVDQNLIHPEWRAADGLHSNDLGHAYFAGQFWPAIEHWTITNKGPSTS